MFTVSLQSSRRYLTTESEPSGHLAAMGKSGGDGSGQSSSHNCTSWAICIPVCSLIDRDKQPAVREVKSTKSNGGEAVFRFKQWIKALDGEVGDTIRTSQLSTPDFVPEPEQVLIACEAQQTNFETDG
ncbi:hypothetical protein Bbelb_381350 [Branchiostoma belcheri]|nr:hypothetical protein Bbelb_381350 [Branchiostoma belcheri]